MEDRICLVTGANAGIGRATAAGLARMGAVVVMLCRSRDRGEAARAAIVQETGNGRVELLLCDLASQASIRAFAEAFGQRFARLHVLINNAGAMTRAREVIEDGLERIFAVNYLGPFLLTNLLLPALRGSAPARIVNLAGMYHKRGRIRFDDLQSEQGFDPLEANSQSQLARVLFTYELARRLEGSGVTANCLHPGAVRTGAQKLAPWYLRLLMDTLLRPVFRSPEKGAETSLYLASAPELEGVTGRYFVRRREVPSSPASYDEELARRLWEVGEGLVGERFEAAGRIPQGA